MIALYCDAGPDLGVGHLMRNVALASAAADEGIPALICGSVSGDFARNELEAAGVPFRPLESPERLAGDVARFGAELVHIDHYGEFPQLRDQLNSAGIVLSSMEDGEYGRRCADLIIDPTLGAELTERPSDGSGLLARGLDWAPVRADVLHARRSRARASGTGRPTVLVVMGGTDACDAAGPVAAMLACCATSADLTVIAPPSRHATVQGLLPGAQVIAPTRRLPELAAASTVVVTAAGTTVWELACIGVPTALVAVTENQLAGYRQAITAGIAIGLGSLTELRADPQSAAERLDDLLTNASRQRNISQVARRRADGQGARRIVGLWRALASAGRPLRVRSVEESDKDLLLAWRNDPATRESSRSTDPVSDADHERWLEAALADPARQLYLGLDESGPIGTVRFDRLADRPEMWEVSITLAPTARGQGLAAPLLLAAERSWRAWASLALYPDVPAHVAAWMRTDNAASNKSFLRAGYLDAPELAEPGYLAVSKAF